MEKVNAQGFGFLQKYKFTKSQPGNLSSATLAGAFGGGRLPLSGRLGGREADGAQRGMGATRCEAKLVSACLGYENLNTPFFARSEVQNRTASGEDKNKVAQRQGWHRRSITQTFISLSLLWK